MTQYPVVRLKIRRTVRYPLVWQRMVHDASGAAAGDVVDVCDREGLFAGRGFYCPTSAVAVRLLTYDAAEPIDDAFIARRIARAAAFRHEELGLGASPRPAYRLVNAEGDGLSGLIVDRFGDLVVIECRSVGFARRRDAVAEALAACVPGCRTHVCADEQIQRLEGFSLEAAPPVESVIEEHGIRYTVRPHAGHKTGFFLDQRDHREAVRRHARGREVLDVCCYTGGFALNAAAAGAPGVTGIDLDEKAIAWARKQAAQNGLKVKFVHVDAFAYLRDMQRHGRTCGLAVLDPPKLAHARADLDQALATQFDFHCAVLKVLAPGGVLLTCSCSGLIGEDAFIDTLARAGRRAGREVRVFALGGPAADHPYSLEFPEGRYLKAVWAQVM